MYRKDGGKEWSVALSEKTLRRHRDQSFVVAL